MPNMCTIIDCKTDSNDIIYNSYTIKSDVPERQQTQQIEVNECNAEKDEHGDGEVGCDDHEDNKHSNQSQYNIHNCLLCKHDINFKVKVPLIE